MIKTTGKKNKLAKKYWFEDVEIQGL